MEKELIDLRELVMMIKEKKNMNANLSLEFDCRVETGDYKPLVKVLNYAINYITQLTDQAMQITLNAGGGGYMLAFTAFCSKTEFPPVSEQVIDALKSYNAAITLGGEAGKFVKLVLFFKL